MVSYEKDFYIFAGGQWQNFHKLNDAGRCLVEVIADIINQDRSTAAEFFENVEKIYITSQDRTTRNSNHNGGSAIDFIIYPYGVMVWLFLKLWQYKFTCYISTYNRHIHFDLREEGRAGVECIKKSGDLGYTFPGWNEVMSADGYEIVIDDAVRFQSRLMRYYYVYQLDNLKTKIFAGLNSPFMGIKKNFQYIRSKLPDMPAPGKVLDWLMFAAGGFLIYKIGKANTRGTNEKRKFKTG